MNWILNKGRMKMYLMGILTILVILVGLSLWQFAIGGFTKTTIIQPITHEMSLNNPTVNLGNGKNGIRIDEPEAPVTRSFRFPWQKAVDIQFKEVIDLWGDKYKNSITIGNNIISQCRNGYFIRPVDNSSVIIKGNYITENK